MDIIREDSTEDEIFEMLYFERQREVNTTQPEISIIEINPFEEEISEEPTENKTVDYWKVAIFIILIIFVILFAVF